MNLDVQRLLDRLDLNRHEHRSVHHLAGQAPHAVTERRSERLAVLGVAVGAEEEIVHSRIMRARNATCMALSLTAAARS